MDDDLMSDAAGKSPDPEDEDTLTKVWPLLTLRVFTPRLLLRPVPAEHLPTLMAAAASLRRSSQRYQLSFMYEPSPRMERRFLQRYWRALAHWRPTSWHLQLGVYLDDEPIGLQEMVANDFLVARTVATASWLRLDTHGVGYGTEARAGALALAFGYLGAVEAHSQYLEGNTASWAVSRKLGYRDNGSKIIIRDGQPVREHSMVLDEQGWVRNQTKGIAVHGLTDCRMFFGADALGAEPVW